MARKRKADWTNKISLSPGKLEGWNHTQSDKTRHEILRRVVEHSGYATTIRRLNVLANIDEKKDPEVTRVARKDIEWVQKNFGEREY